MQHPHPPVGARVLLLVLGLVALAAIRPARADEAPRFLLEKINVTGNRRPASAHIVVSESLLVAGKSYSEDDLRDSIHRIKRLPFVIDADFSLQKGSERGRYELVIAIEETRPLFANFDLNGSAAADAAFETRRGERHFDYFDNTIVGVREPVGSEGFLFLSRNNPNGDFQVGYTQYDLFGPGSFVSVSLADDPKQHHVNPTLSTGVPLTVNQSLRLTVSLDRESLRNSFARDDRAGQSEELSWLYNTTDDPLFPTQGDEVGASLLYASSHTVLKDAFALFPQSREDERDWVFSVSGSRNWPLTARQSLSAGASGYAAHVDTRDAFGGVVDRLTYRTYNANVLVAHDVDLLHGTAHRWGDLRLQTSVSYMAFYDDFPASFGGHHSERQYRVGEALIFRNPWVLVNLGLSYAGKVER